MKPRWTAALLFLPAFLLALLPMTANAAPLPAPALTTPGDTATVDQPVFTWSPVASAHHYEIEVALDDQFVTLTDPALPSDPDEVAEPVPVYGTTYVPTRTYSAKTQYWHVRAVAADNSKGDWSPTRQFTRRWTNDDEPAGTEQDIPASRVENVRTITGGDTPAINQVGFTWDPVPGATYYEVDITTDGESIRCKTPHNILVPPFAGDYLRRAPISGCQGLSPLREWADAEAWQVPSPGVVAIQAEDVHVGDVVYVRFLDAKGKASVVPPFFEQVDSVGGDPVAFTVPAADVPADPAAKAQFFKAALPMEAGQSYGVRVRAVDATTKPDYPAINPTPVYGMWSDERREPGDPLPAPVVVTPDPPQPGSGSPLTPVTPMDLNLSGTDVPLLRWDPVPEAVAYRVTVALDRDFTNEVASYTTRTAALVPPETYDDGGPSPAYYWFATPCKYSSVTQTEVSCSVPRHLAINDPAYVGRFSKQSAALTGLTATPTDAGTGVLLRWHDALTVAQALDPQFTPGGVEKYQIQFTTGTWAQAVSVTTDNLAYATAAREPLPPGTYRWRVRPHDGQSVALAWASGPDFTVVGDDDPPDPTPSPSQSSPTPGPTASPSPTETGSSAGPTPSYLPPPPVEGTAKGIAPAAPGKPRARKVARKKLSLKWRASEELGEPVTEYLVYRSKDGQKFGLLKHTTALKSRLSAKPGTAYWFYVVADSDVGHSEPSPTLRFRMPGQSK